MNSELQVLLDKQALHELTVRYCRAVDRRDAELLLSVYHPDAIDDHGTFRGSPEELVAYAGLGQTEVQRPKLFNSSEFRKQHAISNEYYVVDGDVAWGEIYLDVRAQGTPVHGAYSRILDRYERRNGEWRVSKRLVLFDYMPIESGIGVTGRADRSDPSYQVTAGQDPF